MNLDELKKQLASEGFAEIYVWEDKPGAEYPDHTHDAKVAHVILEGGMTLTVAGETRELNPGDRADVPAHAVHSAKMGPAGCKYLIGE